MIAAFRPNMSADSSSEDMMMIFFFTQQLHIPSGSLYGGWCICIGENTKISSVPSRGIVSCGLTHISGTTL